MERKFVKVERAIDSRCLIQTIFDSNLSSEDSEASHYLKNKLDEAGVALGSVNWLTCERCGGQFKLEYSAGMSTTVFMDRAGPATCDEVVQVKTAQKGDAITNVTHF